MKPFKKYKIKKNKNPMKYLTLDTIHKKENIKII